MNAPPVIAPEKHSGAMAYLVYDGGCSVCEHTARFLQRLDRRHRLAIVSQDDPLAIQLLAGVSPTTRAATFHLVSPRGHVASGEAAIPSVVRLLPGGALTAWCLTSMPGHRRVREWLYRWVVRQHDQQGV